MFLEMTGKTASLPGRFHQQPVDLLTLWSDNVALSPHCFLASGFCTYDECWNDFRTFSICQSLGPSSMDQSLIYFCFIKCCNFSYLFFSLEVWFNHCFVAQLVKNLPEMQETWVQSLGWKDPLKKEMATHSSILAWRIPWTEEPRGLQSMGWQRVGHDLVTKPLL